MSLPAVSKHLKVLERAGLISRQRSAQRHLSHLEATPLRAAARWVETYRQFWEQSFDRLDEYLRELQAQPSKAKNKIKKKRSSTKEKSHGQRQIH